MHLHANDANYSYKYKHIPNTGQHSFKNSSSGLWKPVEVWKTSSW